MPSFKEIRDMILISYDNGDLSDEEFLMLFTAYQSRNPEFPYAVYGNFCLDEVDEAESLANFRIRKQDIPLLAEILRIPEQIRCPQRTVCSGIEQGRTGSRKVTGKLYERGAWLSAKPEYSNQGDYIGGGKTAMGALIDVHVMQRTGNKSPVTIATNAKPGKVQNMAGKIRLMWKSLS